jgi:CheY-like chemotaxis protein
MLLVMRILLLEDHPDTRDVTARLLRTRGHEVLSFENGEAILRSCQIGAGFDLLISDIGLPGESGLIVLTQLRASCPPFKAIAVTAFARPEELEQCRQAGFDGCLAKPISFAGLAAEIDKVSRS